MSNVVRSWIVASACALGVIGLGGCSADTSEEETPSADQGESEDELKAARATEADDGKTVSASEGQTFVVEVAENASTGFRWEVTGTDRTFGYPYYNRFFAPSKDAPIGSGGVKRFYWKTKSVFPMIGKHTVELSLARPGGQPTKKIHITVDIQKPGDAGKVIINSQSNNQTVDVKKGSDFSVKLAVNSSAGYSWQVESVPRDLGQPSDRTYEQGEGAIGSSGWDVLTWKTNSPVLSTGAHQLKLRRERIWSPADDDVRFTVTINITE